METPRIVRLRSHSRRLADVLIALAFPGGRFVAGVLWNVEGFLFPHEAVLLYQVARYASAGRSIVEIGSMRGLSTCCLAAGMHRAERPAKVIAIDPHLYGSEPEFRYNIDKMRFGSIVDVRVARAEEIASAFTEEISAVFLDGAHDLQSVLRDFDDWRPKVRPGGLVLIHDSTELSQFPGPAFLADRKLKTGTIFDAVGRIGSITWGRKAQGGEGAWRPHLRGASALDKALHVAKRGRNQPRG